MLVQRIVPFVGGEQVGQSVSILRAVNLAGEAEEVEPVANASNWCLCGRSGRAGDCRHHSGHTGGLRQMCWAMFVVVRQKVSGGALLRPDDECGDDVW